MDREVVAAGVATVGEPGFDALAFGEQVVVPARRRTVTDHPGVAAVVVARATRSPQHLEDVEGAHLCLTLQGVVTTGVPDDDTPGGQVDAPRERRCREQQGESALAEPRLDALLVGPREASVVEPDPVDDGVLQGLVLEVLRLPVGRVVAADTDRDITLGQFVAGGLCGRDRVLSGRHEHQRLTVLADVLLHEVERPVEPAVLVGKGVLAVAVDRDIGRERDRPVVVVKRERRLLGGVEPGRHVLHVTHRRRERDDSGVTQAA
jgi:hypothetical protein